MFSVGSSSTGSKNRTSNEDRPWRTEECSAALGQRTSEVDNTYVLVSILSEHHAVVTDVSQVTAAVLAFVQWPSRDRKKKKSASGPFRYSAELNPSC